MLKLSLHTERQGDQMKYGMLNLKLEKLQFWVSYSSLKRNIKQYFARYSSFFSRYYEAKTPHLTINPTPPLIPPSQIRSSQIIKLQNMLSLSLHLHVF